MHCKYSKIKFYDQFNEDVFKAYLFYDDIKKNFQKSNTTKNWYRIYKSI